MALDSISQQMRDIGNVQEMVDEVIADDYPSLVNIVEDLAGTLADRCDQYAIEDDHNPGWVKKKAREALVAQVEGAIQRGGLAYF